MNFTSRTLSRVARTWLFALAAAVALPSGVEAQDNNSKKEMSDKVSEAIDKVLKPLLQDGKANADKIMAEVDRLLSTADKDSMDRLVLLQIKVQAIVNKGDYAAAISPMEEGLTLAEQQNLMPISQRVQWMQHLASLYQMEAANMKDQEQQRKLLEKAYHYARRYLDAAEKERLPVSADFQMLATHILYSRATVNPDKVDMELLKQAQAEAEKGLLLAVKPKDTFYVLLMACLQQQGDYQRCADYLELLVRQFPQNKGYWQQLAATYLQLGQDLKAALTLERAQAQNPPILNEPAQNYNLVGIYFNLKQFDHAAQLLEAWLRNGQVPNDQKNWELLAACYQQLFKEDKALATLKEAVTRFPKSGSLEQQIGQIYYAQDKFQEAYNHLLNAVKKGVNKPAQTWGFIAYLAFELKRLDDALSAAQKAVELEPNNKQSKQFLDTLKANIAEREQQRAAQLEKAKKAL